MGAQLCRCLTYGQARDALLNDPVADGTSNNCYRDLCQCLTCGLCDDAQEANVAEGRVCEVMTLNKTPKPNDPAWDQGQWGTCAIYSSSKAVAAAFQAAYPGFHLTADRVKDFIEYAGGATDRTYIESICRSGTTVPMLLEFINKCLDRTGGLHDVPPHSVELNFRVRYKSLHASVGVAQALQSHGQLGWCVVTGHRIHHGMHGNHAMHGETVRGNQIICENSWGSLQEHIAVGLGGDYPELTGIFHVWLENVQQKKGSTSHFEKVPCHMQPCQV